MTAALAADGRLRVLIVDDNRDNADTLATLMDLYGYDAHACYNGQAALDAAPSFRPDVAVIDLAMPGMDGCELARRLRLLPEAVGCVLIAFTGYGDAEHRRLVERAAFVACLVKPADPTVILGLLAVLAREKGK